MDVLEFLRCLAMRIACTIAFIFKHTIISYKNTARIPECSIIAETFEQFVHDGIARALTATAFE